MVQLPVNVLGKYTQRKDGPGVWVSTQMGVPDEPAYSWLWFDPALTVEAEVESLSLFPSISPPPAFLPPSLSIILSFKYINSIF